MKSYKKKDTVWNWKSIKIRLSFGYFDIVRGRERDREAERSCAVAARSRIHGFAKSLLNIDWDGLYCICVLYIAFYIIYIYYITHISIYHLFKYFLHKHTHTHTYIHQKQSSLYLYLSIVLFWSLCTYTVNT